MSPSRTASPPTATDPINRRSFKALAGLGVFGAEMTPQVELRLVAVAVSGDGASIEE
jgi:hypothetical protein